MCETNRCLGTIHTSRVEATSAPTLTKRDCEKVKTDVRDAEREMGWLNYLFGKESWRDPWVVFGRYNECKRLPQQLDAGAYATLRDRLQAYDRGELQMSGEDAMELRRTVNLVQARYDGVPSPYRTMPADYISPAEQEIYDRFANNITMSVMPVTIPGIAGTRLMGGTEAQARAGGELSAMAFGFMGGRFMQKHGLLTPRVEPAPRPQQTTSQPLAAQSSARSSVGIAVNAPPTIDLVGFRSVHILNRHRNGTGIPGKTEFPASWSDQKIIDATNRIANDPTALGGMGRWNSPFKTGIVDGIEIRVDFYPTTHLTLSGRVSTAYPTNVPANP